MTPRMRSAAIAALVAVLAGCSSGSSEPSGPPAGVTATVTVSPTQATLTSVGATQQFAAVARDGQGTTLTGKTASWSSSATGVATVDQSGVVTAVANGAATITATIDGKTGQATVTVSVAVASLVVTRQASGQGLTKAGEDFVVQVDAKDAGGQPASGFTGSITIALAPNAGNATLGGTATMQVTGSHAEFTGIHVTRAGTGYAIVASSGSVTSAPSAPFDIAPGSIAQLVFTTEPPASAEGNVAIGDVAVQQRDQYDNAVPGGTIALTLAGAPWPRTRLLGTLTATADNSGNATFSDLRVDRPGTGYHLVASSGSITGQSNAFAVVLTFSSVAVGGTNDTSTGFACGVAPGGVFCWGVNNANQLTSRAAAYETVPFLIDAPVHFIDVTTGYLHACARTSGGQVWCWGQGAYGRLGDGSGQDQSMPVQVSGSGEGATIYQSIDAGTEHTCGVAGTEVWCWGRGINGQLGNGGAIDQLVPVKVSGSGVAPLDFTEVSAGRTHTCAVNTAHAAYCWGGADFGELGDGQESTDRLAPVQVTGSGVAPLLFGGISAGDFRTCAVTAGATPHGIYCWGSDLLGFLGVGGSPFDVLTPTMVPAAGVNFLSVAAGSNTTCAVASGGDMWCWGRGVDGEIGNGANDNVNVPTAATVPSGGFVRVSFGGVNGCAVGNFAGGVYCWGQGNFGALGIGTFDNKNVPTRIVQ